MVYINTPSGREEAEAALRTELVVGGFLCAIGYGVIILGAWLFMRTWKVEANVLEGIWLLVLLGSALAMFYAGRVLQLKRELLLRMPMAPGPRLPAFTQTIAGSLVLGGALFALSIVLFALIVRHEVRAPDTSLFALSLPTAEEASNASVVAASTAGAIPRPKAEKSAPSGLLIWQVKEATDPIPAGAPPIILGGLLVIGFGVFFPVVKLAESSGLVESTQKLVAPLLSAVLIGLGASQQSDADHTAANKALAEKGLPPIVEIGRPPEPVHIEVVNGISDASISRLENSIDDLNRNVSNVSNSVDILVDSSNSIASDSNAVQASLNQIQRNLGERHPPPAPVSFTELTNRIGGLQTQLRTVDKTTSLTQGVATNVLWSANAISARLTDDVSAFCKLSASELTALKTSETNAIADEAKYEAHFHWAKVWAVFGAHDKTVDDLRAAHSSLDERIAREGGMRQAARCDG